MFLHSSPLFVRRRIAYDFSGKAFVYNCLVAISGVKGIFVPYLQQIAVMQMLCGNAVAGPELGEFAADGRNTASNRKFIIRASSPVPTHTPAIVFLGKDAAFTPALSGS